MILVERLSRGQNVLSSRHLAIVLLLSILLVISIAVSAYFALQNTTLSGQLNAAYTQSQIQNQPLGPFIRNGTTFEQIALNTGGLANGTTVIFRGMVFTYFQAENSTTNTLTFKVSAINWSETLTVNPSIASTQKTAEVYTHNTNPIAGLVTNLDESSPVFLVVSV
jgi:uncharacterized protein (UPF0333 family)